MGARHFRHTRETHGVEVRGAEVREAEALERRMQPDAVEEPLPTVGGRWAKVYVATILSILALFAILIPVAPVNLEAERQELASPPQLVIDGHPNVGVLADAGDWFEDHFAFRQQLITANARLQTALFGTSPTTEVIDGTDGWLYYGGTLDDFQRTDVMDDAMAENAAYNLALMQGYVESRGAQFLLAVAPDKNSLYPQYMPWWLPQGAGPSSLDVFSEVADEAGLHTVDLTELFEDVGGERYMRTDTHWDGEGARLVYNALMDALAIPHESYANAATSYDESFVGDLESLLYPSDPTPEPLEVFEGSDAFRFEGEGDEVEDDFLLTRSEGGQAGSLLMYRDSFANTLLPFLATAFERACFTKLEPYDLSQLATLDADVVVVERAERHLAFFATDPPVMAAPTVKGSMPTNVPTNEASLIVTENGPYLECSGTMGNSARADRILLAVENPGEPTVMYLAFRQSLVGEGGYDNGGFKLYLPKGQMDASTILSVVSVTGDDASLVTRTTLGEARA